MAIVSTSITRLCDGLQLAASVDDGQLNAKQKNEAKAILKQLTNNSSHPKLHTVQDQTHQYNILTQNGVIYMAYCEKSYPTKLAYTYLEEIAKEFEMQYGREVEQVERPYAFIKFDTYIQKTKKVYMDTRTSRNIDKLKEDLHDVQQIFRSNIEEILGRGERLETLSAAGSALRNESKKYQQQTVYMNRMAMIKKWAPLIVMALMLAFYLWWKLR
eukprot:EG_transcript_23133